MATKADWLEGIERARRRARAVRLYLYIAFATPVPIALFQWWTSRQPENPLAGRYGFPVAAPSRSSGIETGIWNVVATALVLALVLLLVRRYSTVARSAVALLDLPSTAEFDHLRATVSELAHQMGIVESGFVALLDPRNFGASPSVARFKGDQKKFFGGPAVALVLPLGFLKIFKEEPDSSKAILAHELAHIRQQDWQIWSLSSAYAEAMKTFVLPLTLFLAGLGVMNVIQLSVTDRKLKAAIRNSRDYTEVLDYEHAKDGELNSAAPSMSSLFADPRAQALEAQTQIVNAYSEIASRWIGPLIQFLILRIILRMRGKSERLADQASAVYVGAPAIYRALYRYAAKRPLWSLFSAHPPLLERLSAIRGTSESGDVQAIATLSKEQASGRSAKVERTGPSLSALLGFGRGPVAHAQVIGFCAAWTLAAVITQALWVIHFDLRIAFRDFLPVGGAAAFVTAFALALGITRKLPISLMTGVLLGTAASVALGPGESKTLSAMLWGMVLVALQSGLFLGIYAVVSRRRQFGISLLFAEVCSLCAVLAYVTARTGIGDYTIETARLHLTAQAARVLCIYIWWRLLSPTAA